MLRRTETTGELGNTEINSPATTLKPNIQYKYWCFTWNGYLSETKETVFLYLEVLRKMSKWFVVQEECRESGNFHLQGTVYFLDRHRLTELRRLHSSVHWEATRRITAAAAYCSHSGKRVGRIWTHNFTLPVQLTDDSFQPYGWQLDVLDIIDKPIHPRIIHWFWEPDGGVGKSELAVWLYDHRNALICMGKAQDIFHVLSKLPDRRSIILFDITKEKMEHFSYSTLEQIKNGYVMSGKYDSCILRFDRPHVIVFANTPPDLSKLTYNERWNIVRIQATQPGQSIEHSNPVSPLLELW